MLTRTAAVAALTLAMAALVVVIFTHVAGTPRALTLDDFPGVATSPERGHHARARHSSPAANGEVKAKPGGRDAVPASATRKHHRAKPPAEEPEIVLAPEPAAPAAQPDVAAAPITAPAARAPAGLAPSPVDTGARAFVRDYYAALDGHDFAGAWQMLSPEVRRAFGGFAGWRAGYARTLSTAPSAVTVTPSPAGATVGLTLWAGDSDDTCGRIALRSYAVTWHLARATAGWRATSASARKLSGPEPC